MVNGIPMSRPGKLSLSMILFHLSLKTKDLIALRCFSMKVAVSSLMMTVLFEILFFYQVAMPDDVDARFFWYLMMLPLLPARSLKFQAVQDFE